MRRARQRCSVVAAAIDEGKRVFQAAGIRWQQSPERIAHYKPRAESMQFDIPAGDTFVGGSTWQSLVNARRLWRPTTSTERS